MDDKPKRWTICADFDGVLHSYVSPYQGHAVVPDPPVEGAVAWLHEMVPHFEVAILTTRGGDPDGQVAVASFLRENGYVGPPLLVTNVKVPALLYVDDRAWRFTGRNWPTVQDVHNARPWMQEGGGAIRPHELTPGEVEVLHELLQEEIGTIGMTQDVGGPGWLQTEQAAVVSMRAKLLEFEAAR